ncbi:cytidylyltransferase domain-containing protein [Hydrogenivirga sp.]
MVGAVIQARMSSTRLPGKVLKELPYGSGVTVLQNVIRRALRVEGVDTVIVATSIYDEDTPIEETAKREEVKVFRGDREDILSRWLGAAEEFGISVIVRITSDNPCIDPHLASAAVKGHLKSGSDYTYASYPLGFNFDIMNTEALKRVVSSTNRKERIERRVILFHDLKGDLNLKLHRVNPPEELERLKDARLTLDTEEDYALLCAVFDFLYWENEFFTAYDVVRLFEEKPWLKLINKKVVQKKVFNSLEEEIEEAIKVLELQELNRVKELLERWKAQA